MQAPEAIKGWFDDFRYRGDVQALGQIFDWAAPTLRGVARHLVRSAEEAEDVVQNTFLTVIEKASDFESDRPLLPWMLGILTLHAKEHRRRRDRYFEVDRLVEREVERPGERIEQFELETAVKSALERMPEIYREVLRPHLAKGLRPEQIADQLAIPAGTVRVRMHRGLKRLRRALSPGFATAVAAMLGGRAVAHTRTQVLGSAKEQVLSWQANGTLHLAEPALEALGAANVGSARPTGTASVTSAKTSASSSLWNAAGWVAGVGLAGLAGWLLWSNLGSGPDAEAEASAPAVVVDDRAPARRSSEASNRLAASGLEASGSVASSNLSEDQAGPEPEVSLGEPGWWLVGKLTWENSVGTEVQAQANAQVFVQDLGLSGVPLVVEADAAGNYAVEISSLVRNGVPVAWLEDLSVRVQSPGCLAAGGLVAVGAIPSLDQLEAERFELSANFHLTPSPYRVTCDLVGFPDDDAGSNTLESASATLTTKASATLGAFALPQDEAERAAKSLQVWQPHFAGAARYDFVFDEPGSYVVFALLEEHKPLWRVVELDPASDLPEQTGPTSVLIQLSFDELSRGASLAGQARLSPKDPLPGGALQASLVLESSDQVLRVEERQAGRVVTHQLAWRPSAVALFEEDVDAGQGQLLWRSQSSGLQLVDPNLDAGFHVKGLQPEARYSLAWDGMAWPTDTQLSQSSASAPLGSTRSARRGLRPKSGQFEAVAPAVDLRVELDLEVHTLFVHDQGRALSGARVRLQGKQWKYLPFAPTAREWEVGQAANDRTGEDGRFTLILPRSASLRGLNGAGPLLSFSKPGFEEFSVQLAELPVDESGQRLMGMTHEFDPARLTVRMDGWVPTDLGKFRLRGQYRSRKGQAKSFSGLLQSNAAGELELRDLEPGHYELSVRPVMAGARGWFGSYLCPFELEFDVQAGEWARTSVAVTLGGRLRLVGAAAVDEVSRVSQLQLLSASGEPVKVGVFVMDPASGLRRNAASWKPVSLQQSWPNLAPGTYEFVRTQAGELERFPVEILPGQTCSVDLGR